MSNRTKLPSTRRENHTGRAPTKTTYWREWPGLRALRAPPGTHTARRSPRGAAWETQESHQWRPPPTGSGRDKETDWRQQADRETDRSEDGWSWFPSALSTRLTAALLCSVWFCTSVVPRHQTWFWLWPARLWGFQGGIYETRMSDALHLLVRNMIDGAE